MMLRSKGKPPLAKSPIQIRQQRGAALQPTLTDNIISPPGPLTKSQLPTCAWNAEQSDLWLKYQTISCELRAMTKMVHPELKTADDNSTDCGVSGAKTSPLFERGRFYEVYSARRNERLKRKQCEMEQYTREKKPSDSLGVTLVSANKLDSRRNAPAKKADTTPVVKRREAPTPMYTLRSSARKENMKKTPLPMKKTPLPIPILKKISSD